MDKTPEFHAGDPVVVTGLGWEVSCGLWKYLTGGPQRVTPQDLFHDCSPVEFLVQRKTLKFMSKQDRLALSASAKALSASGALTEESRERCGLFMAVGYIAFERAEAETICAHAQENGRFSMRRFSAEAFDRVNPLLAFACLPNMPAHHVSANLDLRGEYFLTYPGTGEFYAAMKEAVARLRGGDLEWVLVGGVGDQSNFLVQNHFAKMQPGTPPAAADASAFMVLELEGRAGNRRKKALARIAGLESRDTAGSQTAVIEEMEVRLGPAELPLKLAAALAKGESDFAHVYHTSSHRFSSRWRAL